MKGWLWHLRVRRPQPERGTETRAGAEGFFSQETLSTEGQTAWQRTARETQRQKRGAGSGWPARRAPSARAWPASPGRRVASGQLGRALPATVRDAHPL